MDIAITEDTYAEQPALEWLRGIGWEYVHGPSIAPDALAQERATWDEVILVGRLRSALVNLNPDVPRSAIELVVDAVRSTDSPAPILDHLSFHEMLTNGVAVTVLEEGEEKTYRAKLVDFEHPERNEFTAINQFTIIIGRKNRRPDILLFINGVPLGQIELKNPADQQATAEKAAKQLAHYVDTIPKLYRYIELVGVSDLFTARVGTITTPPEHYAEWRLMDKEQEEGRSALDLLIHDVFRPERYLDLIENFVLFEQTEKGKTVKIAAKYHQVDAVNRAVESTWEAMQEDGRAGVVWHTQGSGKSYSMVFYVAKLRRDARFENPTVVAVTDRTALDGQLGKTFLAQRRLAPAVKQADSIDDLHTLLQTPADDIIFTTIQKFQPRKDETHMSPVSLRRNLIVMTDEAHRSQYSQLAQNIQLALPNATRIGFTGTPIEKTDRSTSLIFGDYISVYRMERAQEDHATVPIYYENRRIPLDVKDDKLVEEVEETLSGEEDEAASKLVRAWAKLERVVGTQDRLVRLADDIAAHYQQGAAKVGGKAMVVAMSQRIAAELTELLKERLGDETVTCVISASATDDPQISKWRRSKRETGQVEEDFKDEDNALKLVVVRDMWLTGFDVPSLYTLYVDKPMKDHGLLQAIARVNRVFHDKAGGLVVDYIGIGDDLRTSLAAYNAQDVKDVLIPIGVAAKRLREKHEILSDFFHDLPFRRRHTMSPIDRANLLHHAWARVLTDEDEKKRYLKEYGILKRLFKLLRANDDGIAVADDVAFFAAIAEAVMKYTPPEGQASQEAQQTVKQFLSEGLAAGEVVDVFELAGEERPEISVLSNEFLDKISKGLVDPVVGIELLKRILSDEIRVRLRANAIQGKLFSDKLNDVLAQYSARQIVGAAVIKKLIELAEQMREARRRNEQLGLSIEEVAFYDALVGRADDWEADPDLAAIAQTLVKQIKADLTVDWADHEATEAAIRVKIKHILRTQKYKPPMTGGGRDHGLDRVTNLILDQARVLYRFWPEVFARDLPI
jgi:type I restriction enzyme R subunit